MNGKISQATERRQEQFRTLRPSDRRTILLDGTDAKATMLKTLPNRPTGVTKGRITMKDIARDLGLSLVTVSRAIRNQPDVSEKTRMLVLERAQVLNFKPNLAARALAMGRTHLVGLVVPDLLHTFFAEIAKSISASLRDKGYCLTISTTDEDPDLERNVVDHLLAWHPDALIIASAATHPEQLAQIRERGTPLLLIDRRFPRMPANYIGVDDVMVGALATEHLISIGCRRIVHLRGPDTSPGIGRMKGFIDTLSRHRIKRLPGDISAKRRVDVHSRESGAVLMKEMLKLEPPPDGVFSYNDPMAIGAVDTILAEGFRVPDDIAVIGSGNVHYGSDLRVPLSTINQRTEQIGQRAASLVLSLIESAAPIKPKALIVKPELIVRASTQRRR